MSAASLPTSPAAQRSSQATASAARTPERRADAREGRAGRAAVAEAGCTPTGPGDWDGALRAQTSLNPPSAPTGLLRIPGTLPL